MLLPLLQHPQLRAAVCRTPQRSWRRCVLVSPTCCHGFDHSVQDASIQQGIQQLRNNVAQIAALRIQSLNSIDDGGLEQLERIDSLTTETRGLSQELKERIKRMEGAPMQQDAQLRRNRVRTFRVWEYDWSLRTCSRLRY